MAVGAADAAEAPSRFHASWFAFTMGTGALGIALSRVPWATHTFTRIGLGLWLGNAAVFVVLTVGFCFRLASLRAALRIEEALFLGAFAVTFVTLSTGTSTFGVAMGASERSSIAAHVIWLASASLCAIVSSALPVARVLATAPEQSPVLITTVSPTWILAFAPVLVSALAGGVVLQGPTLLNTSAVAASLLLAYMLFAVGVFFTHSLMVLYFLQLVYQQYSPGIAVYWICVAPPSVAGSSAVALARAFEQLAERLHQLPPSLQVLQSLSTGLAVAVALGCWVVAVWWLLLAIGISVNNLLKRGFPPWTPGLWAFIFPLSAFAQLCSALSTETGIIALRHLCGILTLSTLVMWVLLLSRLIVMYVE